MNPALQAMLSKYPGGGVDEKVNALREVMQELALLGLWRGKFFERAAFYGGTALRILYGLDRFSEDLDFSLLSKDPSFSLSHYESFVVKELEAWGFVVSMERKKKTTRTAIESAFLKANTQQQLLVIEAGEDIAPGIHPGQQLKIKIEVDTDPPGSFATETKFCLQPIPFSIRAYAPSSLFAGKMHALLCRNWKQRAKGRDWYDFVWYVGRGTELDLRHLEVRMRQSGHYRDQEPLSQERFAQLLDERIAALNIAQAKADVIRFLRDPSAVEVWSPDFLRVVAGQVRVIRTAQ